MLTISSRTDAALRAVLALARPGGGPADVTPVSGIAARTRLSRPFLQQVLLSLKHRGLVVSRAGRRGGYRLSKPANEISVGDVLRAMQGDLAPMACASATGRAACPEAATCSLRPVWTRMRLAAEGVVDRVSIRSLAKR
ncbi:MAG: Rrf2 family transcriptional regulator [bacterium]